MVENNDQADLREQGLGEVPATSHPNENGPVEPGGEESGSASSANSANGNAGPETVATDSVGGREADSARASAEVGGVEAGEAADEAEEQGLNELGFRPDEMVDDDDEDLEGVAAAAVDPIEEFVDDSVVEQAAVESQEMEWYILKVQVNRENSICDGLRRRIKVEGMDSYFGEVLVPTEDVREYTKAGKQRVVKKKLYPGYIVVQMKVTEKSFFLVRETDGIGDFTGTGGKPVALSADEISRIIRASKPEMLEDGEEVIKTSIPFKLEDRVRVKEGYFQNYEGEVSNVDERNGRVTVLINIFGRPNPVELDHWHVEKV